MAGSVARRHGLVAPHRRITAYLRLLGRGRLRRSRRLGSLRDEIEPQLRGVVADALGVESEQLAGEVALEHDLAVDSLDQLEVLARVEEAFGVVVPDREAASIRTMDDLTAVTTALVACRLRAHEDVGAQDASTTLRMGSGVVPRFLRTFGAGPYERELLEDDLRHAGIDEPVVVEGGEERLALERTLLRATLAGADVRAEPQRGEIRGRPGEPLDDGAGAWPRARLAELSGGLIDRLAAERDAAVALLADRDGARAFAAARAATNGDLARFRAVIDAYLAVLTRVRPAVHGAARALGRLEALRRSVDERLARGRAIREGYDAVGTALADAVDALELADDGAPTLRHGTRAPVRAAQEHGRQELRA